MKQVLALLGAVVMVAVALAIRSSVIEDDGAGLLGGSRDVAGSLRCASELADVCRALADDHAGLDVVVEAPGATVERLAGGGVDGVWLVPGPWIGIADVRSGGRSDLGEPTGILARSPLVIVGTDRFEVVCGDPSQVWRCFGDDPAVFRPGIEGVDSTAGLWARAAAATAYVGGSFAANDLGFPPDAEPGGATLGDWVRSLLAEVPSSQLGTPIETMVRDRSATYDLAVSIEAVAVPRVERSRYGADLRVIYPSPMTTVDVAAVALGGDGAEAILDLLRGDEGREVLAAAGWRVDGVEPLDVLGGAPALPDADGLPGAGVLAATASELP